MKNKIIYLALFSFCLCFILPIFSYSQTPIGIITSAQWFEREGGIGVTWKYYHFDNLFNSQQEIWVGDIDLNTPGIKVSFPYAHGTPRRTVSDFASTTPNSALMINGNFWVTTVSYASSVQFLKVNGSVINYNASAGTQADGAIIIDSTGQNVEIAYKGDYGDWTTLTRPNVMATNVMLVRNGTIFNNGSGTYYTVDRHPRTVVGINTTTNHLFFVNIDGRSTIAAGMTLYECATTLLALGAHYAINMDGGGSSTFWVKDELHNGVLNNPSDGYERAVANGVCVSTSTSTTFFAFDARYLRSSYSGTMIAGTTQTGWMEFVNYGTTSWNQSVFLGTTEPRDRASDFYTLGDWSTNYRPTAMDQISVLSKGTARFTFTLTSPNLAYPTTYTESFGILTNPSNWFSPEQNRWSIQIIPLSGATGNIIIENRSGGQFTSWYSETGGWADSGANCTAPGLTPAIGSRYGSTYKSVAGIKRAYFNPVLVNGGQYNVYVAWPAGSNRQNLITYKVFYSGGSTEVHLDQTSTANVWVSLGQYNFNAGSSGYVEVSNEDIDVSGSMYTAGVMFEPVALEIRDWSLY